MIDKESALINLERDILDLEEKLESLEIKGLTSASEKDIFQLEKLRVVNLGNKVNNDDFEGVYTFASLAAALLIGLASTVSAALVTIVLTVSKSPDLKGLVDNIWWISISVCIGIFLLGAIIRGGTKRHMKKLSIYVMADGYLKLLIEKKKVLEKLNVDSIS